MFLFCLFAAAELHANEPAAQPASEMVAASPRELVVVLHGVAVTRRFTARLERRLRREGFDTLNVSYASRAESIGDLADTWLPAILAQHHADEAPRLHFVTHSMGGLLVRRLLAQSRPANLGRVVMIATPNHGSEVADRFRKNWLIRGAIGVNLNALGTGPEAFFRSLPSSVDYPVGILAGDRSLFPGRRYLPRPHDGTVSVASTRLEGMADHRVLRHSHTGIVFARETARQTAYFLRHGQFTPEDSPTDEAKPIN